MRPAMVAMAVPAGFHDFAQIAHLLQEQAAARESGLARLENLFAPQQRGLDPVGDLGMA